MSGALDAIVVADGDARVVDVSRSAEPLFDRSRAELLGSPLDTMFGDASTSAVRAALARLAAGEADDGPLLLEAQRPGGARLPVAVHLSREPVQDGWALVATVRDLTEGRDLRQRLRDAQTVGAVGALASGVAHDFNNLATGLLGFCELLEDDLPPGGAGRALVDKVRLAISGVSGMARQLVSFSRPRPFERTPVDVGRLADRVHRMVSRLIGSSILLTTDADEDLWPVVGDAHAIELALLHALLSARDALPSGGRLAVRVVNRRRAIPLSGPRRELPAGPYVTCTITSTGASGRRHVPAPDAPPPSSPDDAAGGMEVVHDVMDHCGGAVTSRTTPRASSELVLLFPRADEPDRAVAVAPRPMRAPAAEVVLLVEPDWAVRESVAVLLASLGYTVHAVASPGEALAEIDRVGARLDLLVSEVSLPGMSAVELADRIVARRPGARVLFTSGHAAERLGQCGLPTSSALLVKPFTPDVLAARIRLVLGVPPT